jgi:triphosphoribosyl-dephospho-CoA synthase
LTKAALLCCDDQLPSHDVLAQLTSEDTRLVYSAIRLANPGGLNSSAEHDVNGPPPKCLITAMNEAAGFDDIAKQYVTNFADVYTMAQMITSYRSSGLPLSPTIARIQIEWLAQHRDTLIGRKCGEAIAQQVIQRANEVVESGPFGTPSYRSAWLQFDQYLRSDGNRLDPGTTADLLAAAIFVHLFQSDKEHGRSRISS